MRAAALKGAVAAMLAGPTALAFFSGGYFDEPRAWAGLAAWVLVAIGLLAQPRPLPRERHAWLAVGGLALFAGWTLLSITWAPLRGNAYHAGQIAGLYVGALLAAAVLLRSPGAARAVEPALAGGALLVIGYGLSERLLPGLLHFARSVSAQGRLDQPLSYWNAMGELAALGFVLCARLAGDVSRRRGVRAGAAAAAAPLGMGLYVSFSRGAVFACAAGLVALFVLAPRREQLRALFLTLLAGGLAALASSPFRGVTALSGAKSTRELQGAVTLGLLAFIMLSAALLQWLSTRRERPSEIRLPRRAPVIALAIICAGLALAIAAGAKERSARPQGASATHYATLQSNRYAYWSVALRAFRAEPLRGVGAGGWQVYWLRYRSVNEFAHDAHSLPLQTLAELGVVGLGLLCTSLTGVVLTSRAVHRVVPAAAAGPIAGIVVYGAHAPLDWDWQMPAVTLVAIALAGALIALAEEVGADDRRERWVAPTPEAEPGRAAEPARAGSTG